MDKAIQKLLKERYYLEHENTWDDIAKRVSVISPNIYELIADKVFLPSSPTLMNANTNGLRKGTLSSCFTMDITDSIDGIMDALKEGAQVTKASGGVGYVFSKLRASGENIKTIQRPSSGPIPFMKMFDVMLDGVSQGGARKGAGMGQFDIEHPDILSVIRLKNTKGVLERLNISIRIPDEFYNKLNHTPDFPHIVYDMDGQPHPLEDNGKIVSVKKLWDEIIEYAWLCADPAVVNVDIAFRQCTVTNLNDYVLSNPCQPAFATVLTPSGIKTIGEVNIGDTIWSGKQWTKITNKWYTGNKQVYSYNTTAGSFIGTENHRIVQNGKKIEVKDANAIDSCKCETADVFGIEFNLQAVMDGLVIGDGSVHKASGDLVCLNIGADDNDYFTSQINELILEDRTISFGTGWEVATTITSEELPKTYKRVIPRRYYSADMTVTSSFLRGLYSANGSITGDRITLKQTSLTLIKQVQEMLSSLGIRSYYTTNKSKSVEFRNGDYVCKQSYDLNITTDRAIFSQLIGFIQRYKNEKLDSVICKIKPSTRSKTTYDINSIDDLGFHDVFDMTVEADEHTYWTGGLLVSNCQEYWNIPYSSCNLGSINLTKFVVNGELDWIGLDGAIRKATRFLNNIIDNNDFPLEKIKDVTLKVRPIGLGVMGYAHMLYMMKIPFNSESANRLCDRLFNMLTLTSMDESVEIAKESGAYPAYDEELFFKANDRFFANGANIKLANRIRTYKIANSCNTSIAPTGTISYISNVSGGIEPLYALTYARKIEKANKEYETVYISDPFFAEYLVDNFDEPTREKILKQVAAQSGSCQKVLDIPEDMRKVFVVAGDLTPMEHLESLAIVAKNTSLSVSKTINMPNDATREQIAEVYLKAHELGVIGVSVYRDGCRDQILTHSVDKNHNESIVKTNAPKRPKKLPCHVYRVNALNRINMESEKWIIFVGLLGDDPYEIIAGKITDVDFDTSITEGEMVKYKKEGKTAYRFVSDGVVLVEDVQGAYLNEMREAFTRLMSLALRHGAGIEYLKDVLQKSNGTIVDFSKAIIRGINKYVKDVKSKEKCPTCNANLIYVESCVKCENPECSFSKCSG